jgi:hypothetical protein
MPKLCIPQDVSFQTLLSPAADAAGRTSSYFSVKGAVKAWIVVHINQGNAATILLSPMQDLVVAGSTPIACRAGRIFTKLAATEVNWTEQTAGVSYTTDAGVAVKIVVFEIELNRSLTPESASGVYDCLAISTGASNVANITSAMLLWQPKHKGASTESVITD